MCFFFLNFMFCRICDRSLVRGVEEDKGFSLSLLQVSKVLDRVIEVLVCLLVGIFSLCVRDFLPSFRCVFCSYNLLMN